MLQESVKQVLLSVTGNQYHIGCGKTVENISDIRISYFSALRVLCAEEEPEQQTNVEITEAIRQFRDCLLTRETASILRSLDAIEACMVYMNASKEMEKYYCYKLLTVYFSNMESSADMQEERNRLIAFTDRKQLFLMLNQSIRRLSQATDKWGQNTEDQLKDKMFAYIDMNFNDPNFSLNAVADHLGTSYYMASRLFNRVTGKRFKEYVTDKRLEYAKRLLSGANYQINEISVMSGFDDRIYFSRLFKGKYKMNNGQDEFKGLLACRLISKVRRAFQVLFYISLVAAIFIFIKLTNIKADFVYYNMGSLLFQSKKPAGFPTGFRL